MTDAQPFFHQTSIIFLIANLGLLASCGQTDGKVEPNADSSLFASAQNEAASDDVDHFANRVAWIDAYAKLPEACVDRVDELDGTRALFHGCWDWHSSVHAHWAVLRADLTGAGGSHAAALAIDARLTTDGLAQMQVELADSPTYEMPYGRGWFLRLASEHEFWGIARGIRDPDRLRATADAVAASMLAYYDGRTPDVTTTDSYHNDAWPLVQLLAWFRHTGDAAGEARILSLTASVATLDMSAVRASDAAPVAFFSRYWGWIYLQAMANSPTHALELINPDSIPETALTPVAEPLAATDVHHLGINWSRAWGLKALARHVIAERGPDDEVAKRLVAAYQAHVHAGRVQHEKHLDDYYSYAHWVPQFAIYGITD